MQKKRDNICTVGAYITEDEGQHLHSGGLLCRKSNWSIHLKLPVCMGGGLTLQKMSGLSGATRINAHWCAFIDASTRHVSCVCLVVGVPTNKRILVRISCALINASTLHEYVPASYSNILAVAHAHVCVCVHACARARLAGCV